MLPLIAAIHALTFRAEHAVQRRLSGDRGQSTAEYALVLLGAAGIALLLGVWATRSDRITRLFNSVLDRILGNTR
jgi:hypothetical protein